MSAKPRPARRPRRGRGAPAASPRKTLRVVAGSLGGRRFDAPPGDATRPTSERVREAIFNALVSLDVTEGTKVLDGFAGSGAFGIEALSRGAAHVTFGEIDRGARATLEGNLAGLGVDATAWSVVGDGRSAVAAGGPFDLVLLDPPYAFDGWDDLLARVASALAPGGVVVIESDREVALPDGLDGIRSRTYSGTVVQFATTVGAPS